MNKLFSFLFLLFLSWHFGHSQSFTVADGSWNSPGTWDGNLVPDPGDDITISNTVTISGITHNGNVTIADAGVLEFTAGTNAFNGTITTHASTGGSLLISGGIQNTFSNSITINDGGSFRISGGDQNIMSGVSLHGVSDLIIEGGADNQFQSSLDFFDDSDSEWTGGSNTFNQINLYSNWNNLDILCTDNSIWYLHLDNGITNFGTSELTGYADIEALYNQGIINIAPSSDINGFTAGLSDYPITNLGTINIGAGSGIESVGSDLFQNAGIINVLYDSDNDISGYLSSRSPLFNNGSINVDGILYKRAPLGTYSVDYSGTPPVYSSTSTLIYEHSDLNSTYTGFEWSGTGTTAGSGVPQDVIIRNTGAGANLFVLEITLDAGLAGNLTVQENVFLNLGRDLNIGGNFVNHGEMGGFATVTMTGNAVITGTAPISVYGLNIEANIQLESSITVNGPLNLTTSSGSGRLDLNGNNITLGPTFGSLNEDLGNDYIVYSSENGGAVIAENLQVDASLEEIAGLGISLAHSDGAMQVNIRRVHEQIGGISINKYYEITGSPTGDISMEISYNENYDLTDPSLISDEANGTFSLYKNDGLGWTDEGGSHDNTLNTVSQTSLSGFSIWTIAGISQPLPVTLLDFTATQISDTKAKLKWSTASESNNKHFEVQRSKNGIDFSTVAIVDGAINSNSVLKYSLEVAIREDSYFRLKQVDLDGAFTHYDMVFLNYVRKGLLWVFPNPSTNEINIAGIPSTELVGLTVMDNAGKIIFQRYSVFKQNIAALQRAFTNFTSGNYVIQIQRKDQTIVKKLVKK
ncbi:T9SS type A sorting domain-containing protein [Ekhidna sp.]|uniref:T9SS type A sorting domain-containing protein n=1 Tax=Ekhidna sp. TaxID=2608089 RepID=UPI003B5BCAF0